MKKLPKLSINLNGTTNWVTNLVPSLEGELAIVNLSVIQRLANLLPKADYPTIRADMLYALEFRTHKLEDMITLFEEELAFHKTVNVITTIGKEDIEPIPVVASPSSYADNGEDMMNELG